MTGSVKLFERLSVNSFACSCNAEIPRRKGKRPTLPVCNAASRSCHHGYQSAVIVRIETAINADVDAAVGNAAVGHAASAIDAPSCRLTEAIDTFLFIRLKRLGIAVGHSPCKRSATKPMAEAPGKARLHRCNLIQIHQPIAAGARAVACDEAGCRLTGSGSTGHRAL